MGHFIICCTPTYSHVAPMLRIGTHLVERGHSVRMLTGSRFAGAVRRGGMQHVPLPAESDIGEQDLDEVVPERADASRRVKFRLDMNIFIAGIPGQARALQQLLSAHETDAVLFDALYLGAIPMLLENAPDRPRAYAIGVTPYFVPSRDTAPFGLGLAPTASPVGRARNRVLDFIVRHVEFGDVQRRFVSTIRNCGSPVDPPFIADCPRLADRFLQLSVEDFEYPRSDMPSNMQFVGPVPPSEPGEFVVPDWWGDLDSGKPVVHVTQGTIDNSDLGRVVAPTLLALAGEDVLVVAATGGKPVESIPVPVPTNARVAEFVPYAALLPRVDVFVTNGGYGGVQAALSSGIPLVVAGDSEDKPETAARVAWSGTGINLRTGRPRPDSIRQAVLTLLADPTYRERARVLATEYAKLSALDSVTELMEAPQRLAQCPPQETEASS